MTEIRLSKLPRLVTILLLLVAAAVTRLPAPWRTSVTTDELIHISVYSVNSASTKFLHQASAYFPKLSHLLPAQQKQQISTIYYESHLLQRLETLFLRDAHPPLVPALAEAANTLGPIALTLVRLLAVCASLLAIGLFYLVGREYSGPTLGLWLAALPTIQLTAIVYAGIGRPYAFAQALAALTFYVFLRRQRHSDGTLRSFLLVVLLVQATDWMLWPVLAPLVAASFFVRYRNLRNLRALFTESWWYLLASLLLLGQFALQVASPTISRQLLNSRSIVWSMLVLNTPSAGLEDASGHIPSIIAALFLLACFAGILRIALHRGRAPIERYALAASLIAAVVVILLLPTEYRLYIVPVTVLMFPAGVGICLLLRPRIVSEFVLAVLLLAFLVLFRVRPESPYARVFADESTYPSIANRLLAEMKPGDIWFSVPDDLGTQLYLYGAPDPLYFPETMRNTVIEQCQTVRNCYVYTKVYRRTGDTLYHVTFQPGDNVWLFLNGFVLFRIPHHPVPVPAKLAIP